MYMNIVDSRAEAQTAEEAQNEVCTLKIIKGTNNLFFVYLIIVKVY